MGIEEIITAPIWVSSINLKALENMSDISKLRPWRNKKNIMDKCSPPGERPKAPNTPKCEPPRNPVRDKSKDAEIKMQLAKDIFIAALMGPVNIDRSSIETACQDAEQIFNRFHKGDE